MNKKSFHWQQHPASRLTTIILTIILVTVASIVLLLTILNGITNSYVTRDTNTQQQYCNQLSDTLFNMYETGASSEEVVEYLSTHVPVSGGSWTFLIQNEQVIFAKNLSTTQSLTTLKDRASFFENLKAQNGILTTTDFNVGADTYTVGMITDRSQFLSTGSITTYEVYIILLFAVLLLLAIGAVTALSGAWTKTERLLTQTQKELLERNQEFERLENTAKPDGEDTSITIHHSGKSNRYKQYKFKFYLNARHAIYINGVLGAMHPHTWEITLHVIKMQQNFIQFTDLEKKIEAFMDQYQDKDLNECPPFDIINPTLENCCDYFKEQLSTILNEEGWLFLMMEMSETPSRSYVISMIEDD